MTQQQLPRVALLDIETAPILGFSWGLHETDVFHTLEPTSILCFAHQWLGKPKVHTRAICDYRGYKPTKNPVVDIEAIAAFYKQSRVLEPLLIKDIWDVLDEADIVIAHNGDRFDIKKINARFLVHGLLPPSPYKTIDTLKVSRGNFGFDSNKLDSLCGYTGIGRKLPHTGKHMWLGCMAGDMKMWRMMKRYNDHDVGLLRGTYEKIKAWHKSHPMLTAYSPQKKLACPTCLSHDVISRGWNIAKFRKTPRLQCKGCGHWFSGPGSVAIAA